MNPKPPKHSDDRDTNVKPVYLDLLILATSPTTAIWLGDDAGHLVQKEVGELRTSLLPGLYVVEFELGTPTYPIHLTKASRYTQAELEAGPTCPRPIPELDDEPEEARRSS
jgi:hypothetical protein